MESSPTASKHQLPHSTGAWISLFVPLRVFIYTIGKLVPSANPPLAQYRLRRKRTVKERVFKEKENIKKEKERLKDQRQVCLI